MVYINELLEQDYKHGFSNLCEPFYCFTAIPHISHILKQIRGVKKWLQAWRGYNSICLPSCTSVFCHQVEEEWEVEQDREQGLDRVPTRLSTDQPRAACSGSSTPELDSHSLVPHPANQPGTLVTVTYSCLLPTSGSKCPQLSICIQFEPCRHLIRSPCMRSAQRKALITGDITTLTVVNITHFLTGFRTWGHSCQEIQDHTCL
jgi:hypothetical protein